MKGFELLSLLLAVLVSFGVVNGNFRVERPNIDEQPNLVNLTGCSGQITYNGNPIPSNSFTVNSSNAGDYRCVNIGESVTVIPIPGLKINTNRTAAWGQLVILDCEYEPGNYHEKYSVTWDIRSSNNTEEARRCRINTNEDICSNFTINPTDFSISFQYFPTRNHFSCIVNLADNGETIQAILKTYTLNPSTNTSVDSRFLSAPRPSIIDSSTSEANFSFSAAVQNDTPITIQAFESEVVIDADCNTNANDPLGIRTCNRILGNVTTNISCNYLQPYHIDCDVTMDLTNITKNTRNVYPMTFLLGTEDTRQTGMIFKGTSDDPLPAPNIGLSANNESLDNISIVLPFTIPDVPSIKIKICFNDSNNIFLDQSNLTINDKTITANLTGMDLDSGLYEATYSLSIYGETLGMSSPTIFQILDPTPEPSTSSTSPTPSISTEPSMSPTLSSSNTMTVSPSSGTASTNFMTTTLIAAAGIIVLVIVVLVVVLLALVLSSRKKRSKKVPITDRKQEEGVNNVAMTSNSMYNHHSSLMNPSMMDPSIMGANSTASLINSDHSPSPPHHTHNGCSCSCHTRSTHSSGPSQASDHSRMHSRQMNDMPRYGYPYNAEMPPVQKGEESSYTRISTMQQQPNHHSTVAPPTNLDLTAKQVPAVQVQEPTPVMINVPNIASPTGTLPFESDNELDKDGGDLPRQNPQRPTHLNIPEKPRHQGSGSSTPVSDSIMLAVMLYLQHQNCNNRKYCPCCKMITKQFEKIAREQGQDTLEKAMKDIQTPGTEGHKQMLRRRGRTPRSPYRPGLTLGGEFKRNRSSSTSKVHDEELTFSSTETEEDEKSVRKARSSRKVHTDDEMEFFLPLSSINVTNKDLASSEPDLNTPIALPPSLLYQGVTPTNPAPLVTKSPAQMKPDSSDESSAMTDDSSSSSSNSQLDDINPTDGTSKSLLLSSASTMIDSNNIATPQLSTKEPIVYNNNNLLPLDNNRGSLSSGYVSSQSESDKEGKIPPLSVSNYPPTHNNNTSLQPVQSDTEFSDSDSYRESSPAHLIPGSPKAKRKGREGRRPSPVLTAPPPHLHGMAPRLSDHRAPYLMNGANLHPYHASPPHKSNTIGGRYHHHTSVPGDSTSIHSSQSVRLIADSSDHSSSGSTHSIHSDGAVTASNYYLHHRHHHHHQPNGRLGSKSSALHSSANMISLPKESSTSTAL